MGKEIVEQKGSLFIVDPNPPGRDMIPPEDMFIYVKFSATPRSRFVYGGSNADGETTPIENGVEDSVDFISTKIKYDGSGKLDPQNQKTYSTTSWTNIGGLGPTESRGVLEGFGIKSIDIKYNASLVPVVDITFTDIRGAGLFDTIKDKKRLSPYSVFFKMPYPVFNLSVKGYFGQSIDYCLHMVNWTSNFDGTTGNFDISANFLGFQQAFLNDMNIGNIIGAVNTKRGFQNLNKIFDEQDAKDRGVKIGDGSASNSATLEQIQSGQGLNIRKIDDFFTKIAKLQIDTEVLKSETDKLDRLKQINGQLSLLKSIKTFIGSPIRKTSDSGKQDGTISKEETKARYGYVDKEGNVIYPTKTYYELLNTKTNISQSSINDNILKKDINYLSIRDYLLINSTQQSSFKTYMNTLYNIINEYYGYVIAFNSKPGNTPLVDDESMLKSFGFSVDDIPTLENYWEKFVVSKDENLKVTPEKLSLVLDMMSTTGTTLDLTKTYEDSATPTNVNFNMTSFRNKISDKSILPKKSVGITDSTFVLVVDFREIRDRVNGTIEELKQERKIEIDKVQENINNDITEKFKTTLGFKPTIDNCFRIITNNTEAMTSTIYDISKEAANPSESNKSYRTDVLGGFQTDVPDKIKTPIAWPSVYVENDKDGLEEIYIGDESQGLDASDFPEVKFVNEVYDVLVAKTKSLEQTTKASVLKNGLDTDDWFPINPIDYKINPWIAFGPLNDIKSMDNFISKNLFNRVSILKNYSKWDQTQRTDDRFAALDGVAANKTFITPEIKNRYKNRLKEIRDGFPSSILGTEFGKSLKYENGNLVYKSEEPTSISGINIGGTNQKEVDYILIGKKYDGIINNAKTLSNEIKSDKRYSVITDDKVTNTNGEYWSQNLKNGNIVTYLGYNVWDSKVSKELKGVDNSKYRTFTINSLSSIDLTGTTSDDKLGLFLNRTNFNSDDECDYSEFLIQSDFYQKQNDNYSKAVLLLSTLPFKTFRESVLNVAFPNGKYNNAKVIKLPKYYLYFIGSLLWKNNNGGGVDWSIPLTGNCSTHDQFSSPKNCYLTKLGYFTTTDKKNKDIPIEPELLNMPSQTKGMFIDIFTSWVNGGLFSSFETDMRTYRSNTIIPSDRIKNSTIDIVNNLKEMSNMIVLAPSVFDVDSPNRLPENLKVSESDIKNYITGFLSTYDNLDGNGEEFGDPFDAMSKARSSKTTNKIKLQIYNYFKNVNDKWVSDTEKSFNVCGGGGGDKSLYDYFKFIDKGWNDIGGTATINLSSFLTLGSNLQTSVYFFMSKLLRDSNFLFQILPTYLDYKSADEVAKIFKPVTTLSNNTSSGPIYCCIYVGGASQALDIGEESTYQFANDGFTLDDPTPDLTADGNNSLVAFRVAFGAENQTIFKNVSLNQQEHKETGEYFKALSELVDKRGGTQKVYQGTDLLKLFKTRSYTCKVDALGCMSIQPLMYFNLENVPFFNGAYLITSVNHSISPNHMTTNFQGVRQSKFITKPTEEIFADIDLDLNETNEIPKIEFTNLEINDDKWKIGVLDPQEGFDFNKWTVRKFKEIGVNFNNVKGLELSSSAETQTQLNEVKSFLKKEKIITNSQVCMFLANVMAQSNYLENNESNWGGEKEKAKFDDSTIYHKKIRYYGVNPPPSGPFKDILNTSDNTPKGILASTPTFTGLTDVAYLPIGEGGNEEYNVYNSNKKIESSNDSTDDEKKAARATISGLTYYNIFPGDGWRFKPRGYLYITGRREYFEYSQSNMSGSLGESPILLDPLSYPYIITFDFLESFIASIYVWKNKKPKKKETEKQYKNSYEAAGGDGTDKDRKGTSSDFALTNEISCSGVNIESTFNAFEAVLLAFNLKDDNNP